MNLMPNIDPRVDAYIARSPDFARPILEFVREAIHAGCPDVEEGIKWRMPSFDYQGAILCNVAAFKQHCAVNFWRAPDLKVNGKPIGSPGDKGGMGNFGRLTSVGDLPSRAAFVALVKQAVRLKAAGGRTLMARTPSRPRAPRPVVVPDDFTRALARNRRARVTFEGFPPGHRREYVEWITEAKTDATRQRRLATAVEWLAEGKPRNWKYMKK
jgi:uncharacterized protein YdeI (YjbR/CyaY-like superfamily)